MRQDARVLVMGIGNILMLDEGVGNRIAVALEKNYVFPDDVAVMDAGTMGLGMLHLFRGIELIVVADAIAGTGYAPGTVVRLTPEDFAPGQVLHSLHDIRFVDVLNAARLIGLEPKADCIGVQIENMSPEELTIGLSPAVEAAIPRAVAAVLYVLEDHGISVTPSDAGDIDPALQESVARAFEDIAAKQLASS